MGITRKIAHGLRLTTKRTVNRLRKRVPELPSLQDVREVHRVSVADGVSLAVREIVSDDWESESTSEVAPLTIVFAHGFTLSGQSWFFQAARLRMLPKVRMLIPDLRGHGDSPAPARRLGVDNTAADLVEAVRQLAPGDDLMLVGHSMGTMTVLGALRHMNDEERARVKAIAMINGSIDTFASAGITQLLHSRLVRTLRRVGKKFPHKAEIVKNSVEWALEPFIATFVYHGALEEGASAKFDIVEFHAEEIDRTSMSTVLGYLDDLSEHDETPSAPYLQGVPGVVMVGKMDDVTPAEQTREIAKVWDVAEKKEFPESGHMLPVECPEQVNNELVKLIDKVR